MTQSQHDESMAADRQQLFDELVMCDEESQLAYLRTQWIETILLQLIESRVNAELSQRELGERLGTPQSSIARIERGADIKISTLFDYLAATGALPTGIIPLHRVENSTTIASNTRGAPNVQTQGQDHLANHNTEPHRRSHPRAAR
ncbi:MAG: helix-turn-helix domain-containing protein [Thermomicrobiales bacterium]